MTDRTTELRRALVATVDAAPYEKPRPRRWVAVAAIAAFAVAGSVAGFATATVSQASTTEQPSEATATEFDGERLEVLFVDGALHEVVLDEDRAKRGSLRLGGDLGGPTDGRSAEPRYGQEPHLAFGNQASSGLERLLDRSIGVFGVERKEVDVVGAESRE